MNETELARRVSAADLVNAYNEANEIMTRAENELNRAQSILDNAFGKESYMHTTPIRHLDSFQDIRADNNKRAWQTIINRLGIRKTMSQKRAEEMDKNIDGGKMPAITAENIRALSEGLIESAQDFAAEAVAEVYEFLRPGASAHNRYKTNEKNARFSLKDKVIITRAVETGWSRYMINHWRRQSLVSVDNIFHLADGNLAPMNNSYNSPMIDAIENLSPSDAGKTETDYFKIQVYGNGNLHLTFKRPDLVEKLNRAAGGLRLAA